MTNKDKQIVKWNLPDSNSKYKISLPSKKRSWMDVNDGHAYRCLPLSVANGFGWEILNPISFTAIWNGSIGYVKAIEFNFCIENEEDEMFVKRKNISSHFGNGIITFSYLEYIFRTSKEHNLFIKGPTNHFKHGAQALEAIVETDWLPYTFTLNWKLTKPFEEVQFFKNEPLATVFPIPRNYLESFDAIEENGDANSDFSKEHTKWAAKRKELSIKNVKNRNHSLYTKGIEKMETGERYDNHQRSIVGCPFHRKINDEQIPSKED